MPTPSRSLSRSRSPTRSSRHHRHREDHSHRHTHESDRERDRGRDHHRHRRRHSRGPESRHGRHSSKRITTKSSASEPKPAPIVLPLHACELTKRDLSVYEPMFAMYLDIQKGIIMEDLDEEEVKGRWKSFIRKWNRGELAEGWYDPSTLEKAQKSDIRNETRPSPNYERAGRDSGTPVPAAGRDEEADEDEDEDADEDEDEEEYGPLIPHLESSNKTSGLAAGPTIPTMQELELRKETAVEDAIAERQDARAQHKAEIRSHRSEIRHMEDEVAPRAEPGTHERRMEKRREAAAANRAFAESRRGGSPTDAAPDDELMGSGENDLTAIKSARARERRKKNEREIRREEIMRARAAEREERLQRYRAKEEETIGWLKTLAKQRFG